MLRESDIYNLIIALVSMGITMVWGKKRENQPKPDASPANPNGWQGAHKEPGFLAIEAHKKRKASKDEQHRIDEQRYWRRQNIVAGWATGISAIALIFLIITAVIAYRALRASNKAIVEAQNQTEAAKQQIAVAKDTAQRQLRAYLEIYSLSAPEFADNKPARLMFEIRNTGQTPAYHVTFEPMMALGRYPPARLQGFFIPRPTGFTESVINPMRTEKEEAVTKIPITPEQIARIKDGSVERLYVWGTVFYWDAFGVERHTDFCEIMGGREMKSAQYCAHQGAD